LCCCYGCMPGSEVAFVTFTKFIEMAHGSTISV
jgi:hypothetical protein